MNKKLNELLDFFETVNEKEILIKKINVYGYQFTYEKDIYTSVSLYRFKENDIKEYITPIENDNRPGKIKESCEFVVVHDTASSAPSATALAHAKYLFNGGGGTSWHYSVGDDCIYHSIPDNETAFHAGDGTLEKFSLTDTGVKANGVNPLITINDGYYYINGLKSLIEVPTISFEKDEEGNYFYTSNNVRNGKMRNKDRVNPVSDEEAREIVNSIKLTTDKINDEGIHTVIGENGNYFMGKTYYNASFGYIANRGGNLNSIGMETMINQGSDLYATWQVCAKLCASLCVKNNLGIDRVKPHHFFSGKPCPNTMRKGGFYPKFKELLACEYHVLKNYSDVSINMQSNDLEYLDNSGRIIKLPNESKKLSYTITVKLGNETLSRTYYSNITL